MGTTENRIGAMATAMELKSRITIRVRVVGLGLLVLGYGSTSRSTRKDQEGV